MPSTDTVAAALSGLGWATLVALLTWLASLWRRDASLVDRVWAVCIAGAGAMYLLWLPQAPARSWLMVGIATAWALRLSLFITWRNWGHGEDRRYQAIRARNQPHFGWRSLYLVFGLQALLAWVVSAPLFVGAASASPLNAVDLLGAALALFGIGFEAVADAQLARFKADARHRGKVMDQGLWRYTRHPNYFGEACVWWGLGTMACAAGIAGAWSAVSPLLMTVLLLRVSGVRLLEHDIAERRPAYRDYIARTNAFFPGPPRRR
jgi:steroid 5-alpha reductase family enzyme